MACVDAGPVSGVGWWGGPVVLAIVSVLVVSVAMVVLVYAATTLWYLDHSFSVSKAAPT